MKNADIFLICLFVRLASVFLVQTSYVPDEYWQSLEVAHNKAFGYGYLTWEWKYGLRSYFYPLIITFLYKTLRFLKIDLPILVIFAPRVLQAILSAYADLSFYRWSGTKKWAIFSIATAWFWFYTGSRTLINTFENCLTVITLSKFPWSGKVENNNFLWFIAFICTVRPTAAILWLPLCVYHVLGNQNGFWRLVLTRYLPVGTIILTVSVLIDSLMYGRFIVTPYEFLKANIFQNVGEFYGTQPWHWYLSIGLPAILGIHILPFLLATVVVIRHRQIHPNELALLGTIVITILVYSFLPHKEFRFLLPLLPICLYISSRYLSAWSRKANNFTIWLVAGVIFVGNVIPAWYFSTVHQRGVVDVMTPLRNIVHENPNNSSLLFLMPCHSTPLYSHLHKNVTTRFLTCEPDFNNTSGYKDEADRFYENPIVWLNKNYPPNGTLPTHIICFDVLMPTIHTILSRYKEIYRSFHTSVATGRVGHYVVINEIIHF